EYNRTVLRWGALEGTRRAMTQEFYNLSAEINGTWVVDTFKALKNAQHITTFACSGREPKGVSRVVPTWPNATKIGFDKVAPSYLTYDWLSGVDNYTYKNVKYTYDTLFPTTAPAPYLYPVNGFDFNNDVGYTGLLSPNPPPTSRGKWNIIYFAPPYPFLYWWYEAYFYTDPDNPKYATYSCQSGSLADVAVTPYLQANLPSENAVTAFFDAQDGTLFAASVPGAVEGVPDGYAPFGSLGRALTYHLHRSPNKTVSQLGTFLLQQYPAYSSINTAQSWAATLEDGNNWFVSVTPITPDDYSTWIIIVAYPRSDFFSQIDQSITDSAIVAGVLSSIGAFVMIFLSYLFTRPLNQLGSRMVFLTSLSF
ncbi:hypothetical protein BDK51DRAFT_28242, partial [Blyttiomyces helicus]